MFTRFHHWSLLWAGWNQLYSFISLRSILIFPYCYVSQVVTSLQVFKLKSCINFSHLPHVLHASLILYSFDPVSLIVFGEEYKLCTSHHTVSLSLLLVNLSQILIIFQAPCSQTHSVELCGDNMIWLSASQETSGANFTKLPSRSLKAFNY